MNGARGDGIALDVRRGGSWKRRVSIADCQPVRRDINDRIRRQTFRSGHLDFAVFHGKRRLPVQPSVKAFLERGFPTGRGRGHLNFALIHGHRCRINRTFNTRRNNNSHYRILNHFACSGTRFHIEAAIAHGESRVAAIDVTANDIAENRHMRTVYMRIHLDAVAVDSEFVIVVASRQLFRFNAAITIAQIRQHDAVDRVGVFIEAIPFDNALRRCINRRIQVFA